ncbi:MAG: Tm-1-like ATP-binding domain-containing protein [Thermomicrobiales bacterium]|nr:Tm-1-like ATP-binding domain-containing protein [Thermomicrobiales bacterium]
MTRTVALAGALDTKGAEFAFVKDLIEQQGLHTLVIDFGVLGEPAFAPDVTRQEVSRAGGSELAELRSGGHKDRAMQVMAAGLQETVRRLHAEGQIDGILGMGGTGGTSIATSAMRVLPIGVPKVMLSTVAGGDVSAYAGESDITFVPSIVDVAGFNRISRTMYARAAGAIAGMMQVEPPPATAERPLIAASMFGNSTAAVDRARARLEERGYEVLVFHATGTGGKTMEALISAGFCAGSLDMTTTELADYVCGGIFDAGPERGLAASRAGVPAVIVPGCVDMANFGGIETVPERHRARQLYQWNPNVTLLRTNAEENRQIGEMLAAAANAATGPVAVLLPRGGVSMLDSAGNEFWDPVADEACFAALRDGLQPDIRIEELDLNINDPAFADYAADLLIELMRRHA